MSYSYLSLLQEHAAAGLNHPNDANEECKKCAALRMGQHTAKACAPRLCVAPMSRSWSAVDRRRYMLAMLTPESRNCHQQIISAMRMRGSNTPIVKFWPVTEVFFAIETYMSAQSLSTVYENRRQQA